MDIESREALVQALTDYTGAVILVSHDPHLVELVADQLWLVNDGEVKPFDGDMEAYRRFLLSQRSDKPKSAAKTQAKRPDLVALKAELARCEDRVQKLEVMRNQIDERLADPKLYDRGPVEIAKWQSKRAEIAAGLDRAESLWAEAQGKLDRLAG